MHRFDRLLLRLFAEFVEQVALELGSAGADLLQGALQDVLETAELLVAVVLGFEAQAAGIGLGLLDHLAGPGLGGLDDLGALHHLLGAIASERHDLVAFALHLGAELLALFEEPAGTAEFVGQARLDLVDDGEDFVLVDRR